MDECSIFSIEIGKEYHTKFSEPYFLNKHIYRIMKSIYALLLLLCVAFVSCNNDLEDFSAFQNQKNIEHLKQIAAEYGLKSIDIQCVQERTSPFSSEEITHYKSFFQRLSELRKTKTEGFLTGTKEGDYYKGTLTPPIMTRESHSVTADYKGYPFKVIIMWRMDGNQATDVYAGGYFFQMQQNSTTAYRFVERYSTAVNFFPHLPNSFDITVQGTFRMELYSMGGGGYPNKTEAEYQRISPDFIVSEKVVIIGSFDITTLTGRFWTCFEGAGEWPPYI